MWIEWSAGGEGLSNPQNRGDFGMLMLRVMANSEDWKERPDNILKPGDEEKVIGPYYPRSEYMTKAQFENQNTKK